MQYAVNSYDSSHGKSDELMQTWLNERAKDGFRLVSTTHTRDNNRDYIVLIMEKAPEEKAPEADKKEKRS